MDLKTLLTADYLDIIFDQRNKKYGGYELRRSYNRRLKKAAGFAILGISACLTFSFVSANRGAIEVVAPPRVITPSDVFPPPPVTPPPPKTIIPPPPPAATLVHTRVFTDHPEIEPDKQVTPEKEMPKADEMKTAISGDKNIDGPDVSIVPTGTGNGNKGGTGITGNSTGSAPIPTYVQQMPQFPGDLRVYITDHIHYPDAAREGNITGSVAVQFVVNEDGSITDAKVVRGIGGGCDQEALRMISSMPKWKPGKQNGNAVKVMLIQSIRFLLQG